MAPDSEMNLPCPLFEGSEKRIEVEFAFGATAPVDGLRSLKREQLDALMSQVRCHSGPCLQMTRRRLMARRYGFMDGLRMILALGDSRLHDTHNSTRYTSVFACLARRCRVSGFRDSLLALCYRPPAASSRTGRTRTSMPTCSRSPACLYTQSAWYLRHAAQRSCWQLCPFRWSWLRTLTWRPAAPSTAAPPSCSLRSRWGPAFALSF